MDYFRTVLRTGIHGGIAVNVWYYGATGKTPQDVCNQWDTTVCPKAVLATSIHATFMDIQATNITTLEQYTKVLNTLGSISGEMEASQVAAVLSWKTSKVGRKYRGRTYWPGVPASWIESGIFSAGAMAAYNDLLTAINNSMWSAGYGLRIFHKVDGTSDYVTTGIVREYPYTQRRRTYGVGS